MVEEPTSTPATTNLLNLLGADKTDVLFIDPIALELEPTAKLIFQIRELFPQVIICLFVRFSQMRQRSEDFYTGEQERFAHYFKLNKELEETSFGEEATLMVATCVEAAHRLSLHPGRIQLTTTSPRSTTVELRMEQDFSVQSRLARETRPAEMAEALPDAGFLSFLPGLKYFGRRISSP